MRTSILGRSGLKVTAVGLGLAAVGRPGYIDLGREEDLGSDRSVLEMERRSHEVLDAAYAAGIRYVDAARSYGRAEEFLASWLRDRGDSVADVVVGSKWGYAYVGDWRLDAPVHEVKDHGAEAFRRQLAESRALLGERLALYQIHSATLETGVLRDRAVLGELAGLKDIGVAVGLSVSGPAQADVVRAALEVDVGGEPLFATVQATWNALERSVGPALEEAHSAGLGVIVKEALANGRLVRGDGEAGTVRRIAGRLGSSSDAVAMGLVLTQPWCDVVLSGAVTGEQVASNARAADLALSGEDLEALGGLAEPPEAYWAARSALPWR